MSSLRILIVEDEMIIGWSLKVTLEELGNEVVAIVASADKAVEKSRTEALDLILMDIKLKGSRTGIDAALEIRSFSPVPIVYLTGNSHLMSDPEIMATSPLGIFSKPPSRQELIAITEKTLVALKG